ncbi:glycoprotease family [Pyrenophora seminiperda CCB06]|uniref:Glycoprotease family n=1 Tax=Pyrenophora seminiperda CCB06 TaxID=1302712 RepID=A0A3M7LWQ0_9PLEO|nr:glycoprotease family [Pyrenophora seminiperda CCB06]
MAAPSLRPLPTSSDSKSQMTDSDRYAHDSYPGQEEQILVHFSDDVDGHVNQERRWRNEPPNSAHRTATLRSSRSYTKHVSRQRSRRRDFRGRPTKPGITIDTSFTRHRGMEPHQVFPGDVERGAGSLRKSPWLGLGRSSTRNKGLGITRGTPQPEHVHREKSSRDRNETDTAISMTPGGKSWQEISPWDRRIPIGISVPTDSISDFSSLQANRHRAGSDSTLVTPSIIITPAAVKSVWSPDTPFSESDYTPSIYSRYQSTFMDANVPPVPALPAGVSQHADSKDIQGASGHSRNDTLDSAGTAFEEDDNKRRDRIMSTGTVFEEDETPLREKTIENSLAIDTSMVPTPRQSQGWWNVITTPFVTTPKSSTWTEAGGDRTPDVPTVPTRYGTQKGENLTSLPSPLHTVVPSISTEMISEKSVLERLEQTPPNPHRVVTSPESTMSASPVVGTAAIGTVLMPRQVDEPRQININIELQDRRPIVDTQTVRANYPPIQHFHTSSPAPQSQSAVSPPPNAKTSQQNLPVFAPPPRSAQKASHWSYDNGSRSSSQGSPALKGPKKHRKVCDMKSIWPFGKKKNNQRHDASNEKNKKKKKRGVCFWGCCCCLIFLVLLAVIIPVVVVVTRRGGDNKPTATQPTAGVGSQWLNQTNYPPIPTGILTIAQPEAVDEESGCVAPTTLWSCALPKELQQSVAPNKPDQPNFKIEITFENGTAAQLPKAQRAKRGLNPVSAGAFIRSLLRTRAALSPSPAPPSTADMSFLGQTTDGNSAPFEGEETGLLISMQDPTASTSQHTKRANANDPTNITAVIPPPMLASDGTAAPANLLPFPSAQPLRLYNRGKDDEHYGFYNYFDRSIFLKQINGTNRGGNPTDVDGGSTKDAANLRCTYSQTRFLVQIWTRSKDSKPLLQKSASNASAVFARPGTLPYPVTVTIDRHGGDPSKKNLYCYEMEGDGSIKNEDSKKSFQFEDRGFGGNLVKGTQGQGNVNGSIDGGTGGCRCQWLNWLS